MADNVFYSSDIAPETLPEDVEKYRPDGVSSEEFLKDLEDERTADDPPEARQGQDL